MAAAIGLGGKLSHRRGILKGLTERFERGGRLGRMVGGAGSVWPQEDEMLEKTMSVGLSPRVTDTGL